MILKASGDLQDSYHEGFLRRAHQLIAWAYQDIQQLCLGADTEEEVITGALVKAIEERFDDPETPQDYFHYSVQEEKPVHSLNRSGKQRQRLDLLVTCSVIQPRMRLVFEAKRLKTKTHAMGKYLGPEGLMCFVNGEYAKHDSVAGMLAYLQDKTPAYWQKQLAQGLQRSKAKFQLKNDLQTCQMHADLPHEWEGRHQRTHGQPIRILHLFLEFNTV